MAWMTDLVSFPVRVGLQECEAWKRKPTVSDIKKLADMGNFDDMMKNGS